MKKQLIGILLGLSLVMGAAATVVFAQDKTDTPKKKKKKTTEYTPTVAR